MNTLAKLSLEKVQLHIAPIVVGALSLSFTFAASEAVAAYEDYVQLTADDPANGATSSFFENTSERWKKSGVTEAQGPHLGEKYYVPYTSPTRILATSNVTASTANPITYVFGGDELVLGGRFQIVLKRSKATAEDAVVRVGNLEILGSGNIYNAAANPAILEGVCKVSGSSSKPSQWFSSVSGGRPIIRAAMTGGASNVFYFRNNKTGTSDANTIFRYDGDASQFFGTMQVKDAKTQLTASKKHGSAENGFFFPGTIDISSGAIFAVPAGESATIGNLKSNGGSVTLGDAGAVASLVVTNAITSTGGGAISVAYAKALSDDAESLTPITLAAGASGTLAADMIALSGITVDSSSALASCPEALMQNLSIAVIPGGDGSQALAVSHRKVVYLDVGDGSAAGSSMLDENASHWSDDDIASPLNDYYIGNVKNGYFPDNVTATFKGASLTLCGSGCLWIRKKCNVTVPDFRWVANEGDSAQMLFDSADPGCVLSGKVSVVAVPDRSFRIDGWNSRTLTIASEIEGDGTLDLSTYLSSSSPIALYKLTGLNTNFTGRLRLRHGEFSGSNAATFNADPDTYCVTLTVSDPRSLGGARSEFAQDAFVLADHSLLKTTGSLTFDDPTRGWSVNGVGRVNVASGETLTLTNMQVTYSGEFRKEGAGTLKLGGTAKFTADALDTPLAGTNVLKIAAGALTPADTTGCDGLAIAFAAGAKLILDASATGDLKTYGLYNVKCDTPIAVEGGARLPVSFALPDGFENTVAHSYGICTVNPTAAAALDVGDFAVGKVGGMTASVRKVENRDGEGNVTSVTFVCDIVPSGFAIIFM